MDHHKKSENISCLSHGPGPQYLLRSLTGFEDHDVSKKRAPSYSMKFRHKTKSGFTGPGPYSVDQRLKETGLYTSPAFVIASKYPTLLKDEKPGPSAYAPEKCPQGRSAPAYSMKFRPQKVRQNVGPGPCYMLPTFLKGEGVSMAFKRSSKLRTLGPGPAYFCPLEVYKKKSPAYSIKLKQPRIVSKSQTPGPNYFCDINLFKKTAPKFSFGLKHSQCEKIPFTDIDNE